MATDGLYPAFIRLGYTTAYDRHVMTRSIRPILYVTTGDDPDIVYWDDTTHTVSDMVTEMVALWVDILPTTHTIDFAEVYDVPVLGEPARFVTAYSLNEPGTVTPGVGTRGAAVQHSLMFKTSVGGQFKFISLDRNSDDAYLTSSTLGTEEAALKDYLIGAEHGWAGADNGRPAFFRHLSITLNDRLQRKYGRFIP